MIAPAMVEAAPLFLKPNEDRRLRAGHTWVFSNEVDIVKSPLTAFEPGATVSFLSSTNQFLGHGYVNPHSLICARVVTRHRDQALDSSLLVHRLNVALGLRERCFSEAFYRLFYGDADGLPGLIIDRYGDVLIVQITTAGVEKIKDHVVSTLQKVMKPAAIVLRNDTAARELENLPVYVETVFGSCPTTLAVSENGATYWVNAASGQKTGWFYDQRINRARLRNYVRDRTVLDLFSYVGGFAVQAALGGARSVLAVDSSAHALELVEQNAMVNGVKDVVSTRCGDAFDALRALREEREHFDVIVLDPPAFIPRRKDAKAGLEAYQRLMQLAMQVLSRDGILLTASCSYHLQWDAFHRILTKTARHVDRQLQIIETGHQGPDHPIHPAIPETEYLKAYICRVLPTF